MTLRWRARPAPLAPRGVLAEGEAARALLRRLCAAAPPALAAWRGVQWEDAPNGGGRSVGVALLGEGLPYVPGVCWLGAVAETPGVWWPTRLTPDLPEEWVAAAAVADCPAPLVLAPREGLDGRAQGLLRVSLRDARPLHLTPLRTALAALEAGDAA